MELFGGFWDCLLINGSGVSNTVNKLLKRDSQRVAFLVCVDFSD